MLARIYLDYDNVGVNAYDKSEFLTLAERYGFFIENNDDAHKIINDIK
jgi:hypothetical protein